MRSEGSSTSKKPEVIEDREDKSIVYVMLSCETNNCSCKKWRRNKPSYQIRNPRIIVTLPSKHATILSFHLLLGLQRCIFPSVYGKKYYMLLWSVMCITGLRWFYHRAVLTGKNWCCLQTGHCVIIVRIYVTDLTRMSQLRGPEVCRFPPEENVKQQLILATACVHHTKRETHLAAITAQINIFRLSPVHELRKLNALYILPPECLTSGTSKLIWLKFCINHLKLLEGTDRGKM
jgi:hypothetical protein